MCVESFFHLSKKSRFALWLFIFRVICELIRLSSKKITLIDKKYRSKYIYSKKKYYFCKTFGGLAQLARAFDWQSKGQGFDSPNLH